MAQLNCKTNRQGRSAGKELGGLITALPRGPDAIYNTAAPPWAALYTNNITEDASC